MELQGMTSFEIRVSKMPSGPTVKATFPDFTMAM